MNTYYVRSMSTFGDVPDEELPDDVRPDEEENPLAMGPQEGDDEQLED